MSNTITAFFKGRSGVAESVYQYDYGKVLIIDSLNLPTVFEVHFTTVSEESAITVIGQNNRVAIPDSCLSIPGIVTAYIYLHSGDNDGETEYVIRFAVNRRAKPDYDEDEKSNWESAASQALAILQNLPKKVNNPLDEHNQVTYGESGQLLRTKGDGSTEWVDEGLPTDEQTAEAVSEWLDEHPEATTTVQDGSLTEPKFSTALKLKAIKDYVTPEMFGAVGDGVTDDTTAIKDCVEYAYDNNYKVIFNRRKYAVSGNNPCGLRQLVPTDSRLSTERNLNIDFNLAKILWTPSAADDCFAFVGYLRNSTWENLTIIVRGDNHYGNVFSTYFGVEGAWHEFSQNIFRSIHVSGKHNHTFDFNVGNNEYESHDDLSLFQEIGAEGYNCFYYTNNSNSVALHFDECSTVNNVDDSTAFYIDGTWGGGLHISNHHFTIMDCDGATMVKFTGLYNSGAGIDIYAPRVEVRETATNWMYVYILSGNINFHDMYSINVPIYTATQVYGVVGQLAEVYFENSTGVYTPFALKGVLAPGEDVLLASLIFDHCSFVNGDNPDSRQSYPFIKYMDGNGNFFSDRHTALMSNYNFGSVIVKKETSRYGDIGAKWFDDYYLNNSQRYSADGTERKKFFTAKVVANGVPYRVMDEIITIPYDMVISDIKFCSGDFDLQQTITAVRLHFYNGEMADITKNIDQAYTRVPLIEANETLYLKAGSQFVIQTLYNGEVYGQVSRNIHESWVELTYHTPSTMDENLNAQDCQLDTESHKYAKGKIAYKDINVTINAIQQYIQVGEAIAMLSCNFIYNDDYYNCLGIHPAVQIASSRALSVTVDSIPGASRTLKVRAVYLI